MPKISVPRQMQNSQEKQENMQPIPIQEISLLQGLIQQNKYKIHCGDCLTVMPTLPEKSMDLIFADPPFNIGMKYDKADDNMTPEEYLAFTLKWVKECKRLLKPNGSMFVAISHKWQADLKLLMDNFLSWRDTIIWHYTFGEAQQKKFTSSWVAIHYYLNNPKEYTFNDKSIRVPSARQIRYKDKRARQDGKLPDNVWLLAGQPEYSREFDENGGNCWLESRVCGTYSERSDHVCQMPLAVLERIVKVASNPGDIIFDPFLGSGTTLVVAVKHQRRGIGIELSQDYIDNYCEPRIQEAIQLYGKEY